MNTYFSWINDLLNITEIGGEEFDGMKFSMLPVDEDVFEIDANTRRITVPDAFNKNGISVQTDEIAEVVYFKINRFYDATDLFNQDVMIEWIAPNGLKGYSVPTVKVLDETTNYVIFGWALASAITEAAGNVVFAVRFYKYDSDNNKIQYSLSTLSQSAKIQPNIGLDIAGLLGSEGVMDGYKVLGDEIKALIRERAENSNVGGAGDAAEVPQIDFWECGGAQNPHVVVLEQVGADWQATVVARGYSNDAGAISYFWKKFDYESGERCQTEGADKLEYEAKYTEIALATAQGIHDRVPGMKFYKKVSDSPASFEEIEDIDNVDEDEVDKVYCNDTKCIFDGVGYYKVVVKNRKGRATETVESDPIIVYPPNVPVDVAVNATAFLDGIEGEDTEVAVSYEIPAEPDVRPAYAQRDGFKVGYTDAAGDILPQYAFNPAKESVSYEWHYTAIGGSNDSVEDIDTQSFTPDKEGDYFCVVTGHLNGVASATAQSGICRVTYRPAAANYKLSGAHPTNGQTESIMNNDGSTLIPYVGHGDPIKLSYDRNSMKNGADHELTDELSVQWDLYVLPEGVEPSATDFADTLAGTYTPQLKPSAADAPDRAIGEPVVRLAADLLAADYVDSFTPEADGYYFCMITNNYNGSEVVVSSPLIYYDNQNDRD